jgi:hypothetical protein
VDTAGLRQMIDKPASTMGTVHWLLRNTNPRLTGTGRIYSTAAVASIGASTPSQLIIGFITKELVSTGSTIDLIGTTTLDPWLVALSPRTLERYQRRLIFHLSWHLRASLDVP